MTTAGAGRRMRRGAGFKQRSAGLRRSSACPSRRSRVETSSAAASCGRERLGQRSTCSAPTRGACSAACPTAARATSPRSWRGAAQAARGWGAHADQGAHARRCSASASWCSRSLDELAHSAARECGKTRRRGARGRAQGRRGRRVRAQPAEPRRGRLARGEPRRALRAAPRAARRGRRHHAVQLPGHGADVDVPDRDHARQRVRAQAVGEGAADRACCSAS